ncbi:DUF1983 domain-containing protein [Achromobacter sp. D10]|uniref:TipJ family phage tail tip protein n=1 Tax=Achromobacter sp. D10 TaxID=3110765 RepID=UPI002B469B54|nr:DUF1983 domain-containing protein [Achromobacter sp. D10]MEB3098845.1 DUF1983 domain-containing protein [Achromobacter sp. D10]
MTEKSMHAYVLRGEGGKGGGGGRVAKEAPDSLHSTQWARIQEAINIGPTGGLYSGPGAEGRDVFLNGTPIIGEDGTVNWPDVEVHFRPGTQNQDPIPGFPGSESTTAVGFDLKFGTPWTQLITGDDYDAVRITLSTDRLTEQNTKNGDLNGYFIDYEIQRQQAGGAWESVMTSSMRGKATKRYTRTHRIELPLRTGPWSIRVRRTSPDSTGSHISSKLFVDAFTVVTDQRMRFPNIAMMGYKIPATLFSSPPVRAVRARGREIRVPSNYDARTRTYSGAWNGTFKLAVSSNPAWVWMDIVLSDIFGLGDRITINEIDRWSLYRIAQYCDELVPDGLGGMEPRFRAVGQIGSAQEAIKVLQDISTIFRGATFAGNGTVLTTADMPASPVYTYSRANVLGEFQYSSSGLNTRYTTAQVSYSNMDDFGRQKVEPVEDPVGLYRYGVRPTSTTAFLCVSRGQAHRMGKWTLLTSTEQTRAVTFKVGLDYAVVMPGAVIEIADNVLAGAMIGGRIASVQSANGLTLDRRARVKPGDFITVNMPSGLCETQRILSVAYGEETIQLTTTPFSEPPHAESGWSVSSDDLKPMLFRVTKVAQTGKMEVTISAVIERVGKHANVDYGTKLDPLPITIIPSLQMAPPTNLRVVNNTSTDQGAATNTLRAEWDGSKEARGYSVQWRRGNGDWIGLPDTTLESVEIPGIRTGVYQVRVQAFSALEVRSAWVVSDATSLEGTLEPPPVVTRLATTSRLYGIGVEWDFPETISPLRATEIYWSAAPDFTQATLLSEVSYPIRTLELPGLKAGTQFWFWARLVDSLGEKGDLHPIGEGVHGITLTDPIEYLEAIKDQVVGSEVGKQMLQDIEQLGRSIAEIDSDLVAQGQTMSEQAQKLIELTEELRLEAVARSQGDQANAMAISAESAERKLQADAAAAALGARIDALQAEVASLVGTPAWEDGKVYPEGFVVSWQGGLYRAKQQVPAGVDPRYSGYWDKIGNYDSLAEAVGDLTGRMATVEVVTAGNVQKLSQLEIVQGEQATAITDVQQVQAGQATRMATVEAKQGEQASKIQSLETVTADTAQILDNVVVQQGDMQSAISSLQTITANTTTRLDTLSTKVDGQASSISTLQSTQVGHAQRLTTLESTQADQASKIELLEDVQDGQALRMSTLETKQGQNSSKIQGLESTTANLASRTSTLETKQGEQASSITTIQQTQAGQATQINTLRTDVSGNASEISSLKTTTAGLVQQSSSMATTIGENAAAIRAEEQARASADDALTLRINQTNTTVGQNTARIAAEEQTRAADGAALSQRITRMEAGQKESFETERSWNFNAGAEGWKAYSQAAVEWVNEPPYLVRATSTGTGIGRVELDIATVADRYDPHLWPLVRARVRFINGSNTDTMTCYVSVNGASTLAQFTTGSILRGSTDWQIVEFNLLAMPSVADPSVTNIRRIVFGDVRAGGNGPFEVDYVAIGRYGAPLSNALLQQEQRARIAGDDALSQQIATLRTTTETEAARLDAAIRAEETTRTTADTALAQSITQLTAQYNAAPGGGNLYPDPYYNLPGNWAGSLKSLTKRGVPTTMQTRSGNPFPFIASFDAAAGAEDVQVGDLTMDAGGGNGFPVIGGRRYMFRGKAMQAHTTSKGVGAIYTIWMDRAGTWLSTPAVAVWDFAAAAQHEFTGLLAAPATAAYAKFLFYAIRGKGANNNVALRNFALVNLSMELETAFEDQNAASIVTEQAVRASADSALGTRIDQVTARVGNTESAVQTQANAIATLDGKVASNWNVRVSTNVNGIVHLAGMGVGVEVNPNTGLMTSNIVMVADQLLLLHGKNGAYSAPFSVSGGQTFIADAYIRDASITSAKIGAAAITNAHLGNAIIGTVNIADGAITSTKIGYAQIHTANINVAQIDTLRLAGGSVTVGISDSFSWTFGKDWGTSDRYIQVYMPYGGTCIAFVQFDVDHGDSTYPTTTGTPGYVEAVGSDGAVFFQRPANDVVWTGSSPRYSWKGTGSYISPAYSAGFAWGFTARCARPSAGTMRISGRMAIISFQR